MTKAGSHWVMVNCAGETLTEEESGGIATWVLGVARAASQTGATVPVLTKRHPHHRSTWPHALELEYPRPKFRGNNRVDALIRRRLHYVHPWQPLWNRRVIASLASVAREPCNLLFHNDPELATVVAEALPRHEIWHLLHNMNPTGEQWKPRFLRSVHSLAVSDFIARWWESALGATKDSVQTVYAGVDATLFTPARKPAVPEISYVGLFNERKAPDLVLAACEILRAETATEFSVRLIGAKHYGPEESDAYTKRLRQAADRLSKRNVKVTFPGFLPRSELANVLGRSSINVVPSRWEEPFSLAVLEGMASGAATVVTNRGGLVEAAGTAAVIVPADDPRALADALRRLLEDASARTDLSARGRQRGIEMSWQRTWRSLTSLETPLSRR